MGKSTTMECMRKEGGESKNGTSRMSVIIEAGALAMVPNFKPSSLTYKDITSPTSPDHESPLDHIFVHMPNAEMDSERFKKFLEDVEELLIFNDDESDDDQSLMEIYKSFVETSSKINKGTQDQRRSETFMASLKYIEAIWESLDIKFEDIKDDFQNDEPQNDEPQNDEPQNDEPIDDEPIVELKRKVAKVTLEYMEDFSTDHPDFVKDCFRDIYKFYLDDTKRVRKYWIEKHENKEN